MLNIYGTLGPSCSSVDTLERMFRLGMTGVRLNLSHVTLAQAAPQIEALHSAAARCDVPAQLLVDLQGPELRIGVLPEPLTLPAGRRISLDRIPLSQALRARLLPGQEILLDDGRLLLRTEAGGTARILRGGVLQSRKSVALPGVSLYPPALTEADLKNIKAAARFGVTGVMQPFVRNRKDLETVRTALNEAGCQHIRLFAKIENLDGVERLEELLPAADEIVIARGDLGNTGPLWRLPALQKQIAAVCRREHKAFMVVTHMLASMEKNPVPTRAEVSDIFNAVLDGASSVMVTGETAVGDYPVEVIRYLANTSREALAFMT